MEGWQGAGGARLARQDGVSAGGLEQVGGVRQSQGKEVEAVQLLMGAWVAAGP